MNFENEYNEDHQNHIKMQNDLIKLIKVLDDCIEGIDSFYCYVRKKQMLAGSNNDEPSKTLSF